MPNLFILNPKLLEYAKTKRYDEWAVRKAVFFILEEKFGEAEEFCDVSDFWKNDKWIMFPFLDESKELISCLKDKGFTKTGLMDHKAPEGYFLYDVAELPKALSAFKMRNPNVTIEELCDMVVRCYSEYQNPMNNKFFIPKLHKFLNEVADYEV